VIGLPSDSGVKPNNVMMSGAPNSAVDAAKRLGVNLDDITINNGVARTKIDLSSTLDPKDINQLKDVLRSRGATKAEVDTGFIANEKLDTFLRRRAQDGKPFNGGTVRFSNSSDSDFTIDFDL
jgi:predicted NAD/FAD-binding protein